MSLLHIGSRCSYSHCNTVDFLPLHCPSCSSSFCTAHIQAHPCPASTSEPNRAGPSTFSPRARCPMVGCAKPTISAIAGVGEAGGSGIGKAVLFPGCDVAYCVSHRQQDQHACPGPRDYTARNDAAEERRAKAKLLLERNFPGISQKSKSKPPEQKSVVDRKRDSVAIAGPSQPPTASPASVQEAIATVKKPKTKEDKLHELHIRKIRSTAVALDSRAQVDDTREKRYFEWSSAETDAKARVEAWVGSGKWAAKPEKAWVLSETPCGKVLDLLVDKLKIRRPPDTSDPTQSLGLVCLSISPIEPRSVKVVDLSKSAGVGISEGGLVLVVRGWPADAV